VSLTKNTYNIKSIDTKTKARFSCFLRHPASLEKWEGMENEKKTDKASKNGKGKSKRYCKIE